MRSQAQECAHAHGNNTRACIHGYGFHACNQTARPGGPGLGPPLPPEVALSLSFGSQAAAFSLLHARRPARSDLETAETRARSALEVRAGAPSWVQAAGSGASSCGGFGGGACVRLSRLLGMSYVAMSEVNLHAQKMLITLNSLPRRPETGNPET